MSRDRTCPSARCAPGAVLLAVAGPDGRMQPLRTAMTVDADFVAAAAAQGAPEARMRFAAPCATSGCAQWGDGGCSVIGRVLDHLRLPQEAEEPLRPCLIRGDCRWFAQEGARACGPCTMVVTDQAAMRTPVAAE